MDIYERTCFEISEIVTKRYSTSFYWATRVLGAEKRRAIFGIYGFVRFADEIVDTFHETNQEQLLDKFIKDYYSALQDGISMNPIIHSYVRTVAKYGISDEWTAAFLKSMNMDLQKQQYVNDAELQEYIYGSADVVGLMCLKVFVDGSEEAYARVTESAQKLGSAFQKVNFLRDLQNDVDDLGRNYFHEFSKDSFTDAVKYRLVADIEADFISARSGISLLPGRSKLAVHIAYFYYVALLKKIKKTPASRILVTRIRISNAMKMFLLLLSVYRYWTKSI